MINQFEELMHELAHKFSIPLKPLIAGLCTFSIEGKLSVQLKLDKTEKMLFIGSFITEIAPGKFKENVFTQTLKANSQIPNIGWFAFNEKNSNLFLYEFIPMQDLTIKPLFNFFAAFVDKAMHWKKAIEAGQNAPLDFLRETELFKPSPFNLKP